MSPPAKRRRLSDTIATLRADTTVQSERETGKNIDPSPDTNQTHSSSTSQTKRKLSNVSSLTSSSSESSILSPSSSEPSEPSSPRASRSQSLSSSPSSSIRAPGVQPLKERLASFLPKLAESNTNLETGGSNDAGFELGHDDLGGETSDAASDTVQPSRTGIDGARELQDQKIRGNNTHGEDYRSEGPYIEMDLNLGVLEELDAGDRGRSRTASSSSGNVDGGSIVVPSKKTSNSRAEIDQRGDSVLGSLLELGNNSRKKKRERRKPGIVEVT